MNSLTEKYLETIRTGLVCNKKNNSWVKNHKTVEDFIHLISKRAVINRAV